MGKIYTKYNFSEQDLSFLKGQGFDESAIKSAKTTAYTCKDYLSGKGIGPFFGLYGDIMAIQKDGVLNVYLIPEVEIAKIYKQRERQYAAFKDEIFKVLKGWYNMKCAKSRLPKKKIDQSILRKFKYENLDKATLCIYGENPVILSKAVQSKHGSLSKWHERIIWRSSGDLMISGEDIGKSVFSLRDKDIFYACAIHAIFDFKVSLGYNPNSRNRTR